MQHVVSHKARLVFRNVVRDVVSHNARLVSKWLVLLAVLRSIMKEIYLSMFVLSGTWMLGCPNSVPLVVTLLP